jgi:hypothetical protein
VLLWLFWYQFHAHLTNGSTAVVCHCPQDMGAMTKFDISSNYVRCEGGKALAAGLKGNQVITELNISSNNLGYSSDGKGDTSGIIAIADAILDMGAMMSLNLASNRLGIKGAKIIAAFLPKCT